VLPGPGRDRLAGGEVLVVTTGQQPALFAGPLYTVYKALSAIALARRLERERGVPVVPVFWVAGDDHDFQEANHAAFLNTTGEATGITLRDRAPEAPSLPSYREPCGPEIIAALDQLRAGTPDSEFKPAVLAWLESAFTPTASLADAAAAALQALLGSRGLAVLCPYRPSFKRAMSPYLLRALDHTLPDGLAPTLVEASQGRDRLKPESQGGVFVGRRSGDRFSRPDLERLAKDHPERLSPNVLLRPVVESVLLPTVAYLGGPGELAYLPEAASLYQALGVPPQTPVPRWSGVLVESRVDKVLERYQLEIPDLAGTPGPLEARLVRGALPAPVAAAIEELRQALGTGYERLGREVKGVDPTLERTVETARNAALGGSQDIEKKLLASLKRNNETLVGQVTRARAALYPLGEPQERVLTYASFAIRYGPALLDGLESEVARGFAAS
jgi:uncharacterized protein YllA (UPF0747 family)